MPIVCLVSEPTTRLHARQVGCRSYLETDRVVAVYHIHVRNVRAIHCQIYPVCVWRVLVVGGADRDAVDPDTTAADASVDLGSVEEAEGAQRDVARVAQQQERWAVGGVPIARPPHGARTVENAGGAGASDG